MNDITKYLAYVAAWAVISNPTALASDNAAVNLVKNGDFQKGTSGWRGDRKVIPEPSNSKNNICAVKIDAEETQTFSQKIKTRGIEALVVRFRLKKSEDYNGEGLSIWFDPGDGTTSGTGCLLPKTTDWKELEYSMGHVVRGVSRGTLLFKVKKGTSGSLFFDDIVVIDKALAKNPSAAFDSSPSETPSPNPTPTKSADYKTFTDKSGRHTLRLKFCTLTLNNQKLLFRRKGAGSPLLFPLMYSTPKLEPVSIIGLSNQIF